MLNVLQNVGFKVLKPQGSYFIMIDWRGVAPARVRDDMEFARWLISEVGVACIPASPFYQQSDKHLGKNFRAVCCLQKGRDGRGSSRKVIKASAEIMQASDRSLRVSLAGLLACELTIFDSLRPFRRCSKPGFSIRLVFGIVTVKPDNPAIALKG